MGYGISTLFVRCLYWNWRVWKGFENLGGYLPMPCSEGAPYYIILAVTFYYMVTVYRIPCRNLPYMRKGPKKNIFMCNLWSLSQASTLHTAIVHEFLQIAVKYFNTNRRHHSQSSQLKFSYQMQSFQVLFYIYIRWGSSRSTWQVVAWTCSILNLFNITWRYIKSMGGYVLPY